VRHFTPEEANAALAEVRPLVERMVEQRRAHVEALERQEELEGHIRGNGGGIPPATLAKLQKASTDTPHQWQHWWWVCFIAQIVFLPFIFLLSGRWSPKKAKQDEEEHEALVERELAQLHQHAQA